MSKLNKRDINRSFNRWWYANEIPNNLDYLLGPSLLYALMPTLRKLYTNDDDLRDAYFRHLSYFNTQAIWGGGTLTGIMSNLEEAHSDQSNRDLNEAEVEVNDNFISMTKTGLMGVLAGVGDAVDSGCVQYIFITLGLPFAFEGNWIGALYPWIAYLLSTYTYGNYFALLGYIKGRMAAVDLVSSKRFQMITEILSTFGLILLGTIAARYIQINLNTSFYLFENINNFLVNLLEGLLSLSLILIVHFYLSKKGLDLLKGMILITIIICILLVFGIL
jgi:PTS system mannose-specific IID component